RAYCLKTQPATGETYPKSDLFNKARINANVYLGAADVFLDCYVVIPRCCRYFTGLIAPNDSLKAKQPRR
ncbi:hypothetical protein, partial [Klebsiella pneumoniae]|uniref:hypothetical protein n=1 Tax=Klebsiella pneumoniae TaxID=573 RepID=UPI001C408D26